MRHADGSLMRAHTSDVAVVGAGITGLSTAFHLGELGRRSVVIYERTGIGAGRCQASNPVEYDSNGRPV